MVTCSIERRHMVQCQARKYGARLVAVQCQAEPSLTGERSTSVTCQRQKRKTNFQTRKKISKLRGLGISLPHRCFERVFPSEPSRFAGKRCDLSPTSRSSCSKP